MARHYTKHFLSLESNPSLFNELLERLGAPSSLRFEDVYVLDDPAFLPHPALALVLIFSAIGDDYRPGSSDPTKPAYDGAGEDEPAIWFRQTIHNACGLYALLHALSNGAARKELGPDSLLSQLLQQGIPLPPTERARILEGSAELEREYAAVAVKGDTAAPASAEDEVDFHYICFVRSDKDGHLYELDGDANGPIDTGLLLEPGQDVLCETAVNKIKEYIAQGEGSIGFNLMA